MTIAEETYGTIKKITFAWTSTAGGIASATTDEAYSGEVRRLVTKPGAAGVQPTDQYDVTVNDEDGTDALMSAGANRSNVNTEQVLASSLGVVANDTLSLSVANAGNAKSGVVYLYIR